jgi:hypothetical protein
MFGSRNDAETAQQTVSNQVAPTINFTADGLPSWLLPAAVLAAVVLLVVALAPGGRRGKRVK